MRKLLIILTRKYPYAFGEPFLESEINKHNPYYDKIMVLAQDVSKREVMTRALPEKTEAYITATGSRKSMRLKDLFASFSHLLKPDSCESEEYAARKLDIVQRCFLCNFESRCVRLEKEAVEILKQQNFSDYDQIVIYSYWFFANATVAVRLKEYIKKEMNYSGQITVISRAHRYDIYEDANKINYLPFRKYLLNKVDYVFPCSDNGTMYLKTKYQDIESVIETAYLGTRDYGLSPEHGNAEFHIVSCSRVVKVKGLERLIDDLALVERGDKRVLWTHIGGGVEGKTKYFDSIREYAKEKLKNIDFEFLGGMQNQQVYDYYKSNKVDVFVNVSYSEGLPVSLMEASSFGIPVIATDVGGSAEIIDKEQKNGFLLDKDFEIGALQKKIELLLNESEEMYCKRRIAARELWEKKYNAEKNYTDFAKKIYEISNYN